MELVFLEIGFFSKKFLTVVRPMNVISHVELISFLSFKFGTSYSNSSLFICWLASIEIFFDQIKTLIEFDFGENFKQLSQIILN